MSDWRMWARLLIGLIIAVIVFAVFMNILGNYRTAKEVQKRTEVTTVETGPASSVTKTGRPPLTAPTTTTGNKTTSNTATASKTKAVLVVVDGVNLRNGPSTTADIIRALKKNERLRYYQTKNGYYEVQDDGGTRGWVSSNRDYTRLVAIQ